jgi:hypothetical protein
MHDYGRNPILSCRKGAKFCCHIPNRYYRSTGFQQGTCFFLHSSDCIDTNLKSLTRCTNYTIHVLLCSFIGKTEFVYEFQFSNIKKYSNKHIMIDLGTGNNNKMCVALILYTSRSKSYILVPVPRNWAMDNKQEVRHPYSIFSETMLINVNI